MFLYRGRESNFCLKWRCLPQTSLPRCTKVSSRWPCPRRCTLHQGLCTKCPSFAAVSGTSGLSLDSLTLSSVPHPFPFLTRLLPGVLLFLLFHVFRQRVLRRSYPFLTPVEFSPVCSVLENSRPSAVLPSNCLLSGSARKVSVDQLCSGCCR